MGRPLIDLSGQRFGRWRVLSRAPNACIDMTRWWCLCDCGQRRAVLAAGLKAGGSQSCGCLTRELSAARLRTHGNSRTIEFHAWSRMRARCRDANHQDYKHYGGRGITVCEEWDRDFLAFLRDMGRRPSRQHTLDRVDVNGQYSKDNCRWATYRQQANNKRNTTMLTVRGETKSASDWSRHIGIVHGTLHARLRGGWTHAAAVDTPVGQPRGRYARKTPERITYKGVTRTAAEWDRALGFNQCIVAARLRLGWSVERALTAPVRPGAERKQREPHPR